MLKSIFSFFTILLCLNTIAYSQFTHSFTKTAQNIHHGQAFSTIVDSNNIILMDNGEISVQGTHEELLLKSEIYHSMWDAHTQAIDWDISVKEGVYNA